MKPSTILIIFLTLSSCSDTEYIHTVSEQVIIVAMGDSITRGGNPDKDDNTGLHGYVPYLQALLGTGYSVLNCGIGGNTSYDLLTRSESIFTGDYSECSHDYNYRFTDQPDIMLLMIGTNDILQNISTVDTEKNITDIINMSLAYDINPHISTIPTIHDRLNASLQDIEDVNYIITDIAEYYNIPIIDGYDALSPIWDNITWDGLHLSYEGYKILADLWFDSIISKR